MKRDAILINPSRGPSPPTHPLFGLDNVILAPHSAGPTWESWARRFRNA